MPYGGNDWLALNAEETLEPGPAHLRSAPPLLGLSAPSASPTSGTCCMSWWRTSTAATTSARRCSSRPGPCTSRTGRRSCAAWVRWSSSRVWRRPAPAGRTAPDVRRRRSSGTPTCGWAMRSSRCCWTHCKPPARTASGGIRQSAAWDPHPDVEDRVPQGILADAKFREGAKVLASKGMSMENTAVLSAASRAGGLRQRRPRPDHRAEPHRRAVPGGALRQPGRRGHPPVAGGSGRAVAQCPNIVMKLGGIGQPRYGFDWHTYDIPIGSEELAEGLAPYMNYCIEQFGPDRCMFESNFPPDKVSYSYNTLFNAFKRLSKDYISHGAGAAVPRHGDAGVPDRRLGTHPAFVSRRPRKGAALSGDGAVPKFSTPPRC